MIKLTIVIIIRVKYTVIVCQEQGIEKKKNNLTSD